jgi:hypothetical protein
MRTTLALTAFLLAALLNLVGAPFSQVTLPDTVPVAGRQLVLNGSGIRGTLLSGSQVVGLYLERPSADAEAIIRAESPKRLLLHFLKPVSREQMIEDYSEAFEDSLPANAVSLRPQIDRLLAAFADVERGDEMAFTYVPGTGLTLTIRGEDEVTVPGSAFGRAIFAAWLGADPRRAAVKRKLLGA